jgi:hypothetical protein
MISVYNVTYPIFLERESEIITCGAGKTIVLELPKP